MNIQLFGLLHLKEGERSAVNVSTRVFRDQIAVYVRNAVTLARSLEARGIPFALLTNRSELVNEVLKADRLSLDVREIPFPTAVPTGIKFYSAHFKFDAFRYLSSLQAPYVGICDLDMICNATVPLSLEHIVANGTPLCYDISDLVIPAYGHDVIIRDLQSIHGRSSEGRWTGGELLMGPPGFFRDLIGRIDALFPTYLGVIGKLHHVGDEAVTSAAIEQMRLDGKYIADAGTLSLVGRYWNLDTRHVQRAFRHYEGCFLLHLPADKPFLAGLAQQANLDRASFLQAYARHRHAPKVQLRRWLIRLRDSMRRQRAAKAAAHAA